MSSQTADAFLALHPELALLDETSRSALDQNVRFTRLLAAYFRFSMSGWDNLGKGPCLVVANHSIGSPFVLPLLARAWHQHLPDRPARGLMHRVAWQWPWRQIGILQKLGGLYAHPEVAARALARGQSLLIFPGGEFDAMRPLSHRYRVNFGDRQGFVRLARSAGVPIVPLAICGSHAAYLTLPGAERVGQLIGLQHWTGLKRFPLTVGGVCVSATLAAPPLWPILPLVLIAAAIPFPTRIEARLLPPIEVGLDESDSEAAERVRQALESALGEMAKGRRTILG